MTADESMRAAPPPEYPRVVFGKQLRALDVDGRECEVCGMSPHDHAWMLLDNDGFALFCSKKATSQLEEYAVFKMTLPFSEADDSLTEIGAANRDMALQALRKSVFDFDFVEYMGVKHAGEMVDGWAVFTSTER